MYTLRSTCRGCGSQEINQIYDFGLQPLAGEFPLVPKKQYRPNLYPLNLHQCFECGLLQVLCMPQSDLVFHDSYRYQSSAIPSLKKHFAAFAEYIEYLWLQRGGSQSLPKILEFGSNDGILGEALIKRYGENLPYTGVDASQNMCNIAKNKGLNILNNFFTNDFVYQNNLNDSQDIISCSNVFAHIDDISDAVSAVYACLRSDGFFIVEVHDAEQLIEKGQFDTIYHEHLTYYSASSLSYFLENNGFDILNIQKTPMHGGSIRITTTKSRSNKSYFSTKGSHTAYSGTSISNSIKHSLSMSKLSLESIVKTQGKLDAYGAAGRSQMFINMLDCASSFNHVFDDSDLRQNRYIVNTNLPIRAFDADSISSNTCVILSWNYAPDIANLIKPYYTNIYTLLPELRKW